MPCEPKVTGIIGGQPGVQGKFDDTIMIDLYFLHAKPPAQREASEEGLPLIGMTPAFHQTHVRQLKSPEKGGGQTSAAEPVCNRFRTWLAEQQGGRSGGIDDLNGGHDLRGRLSRPPPAFSIQVRVLRPERPRAQPADLPKLRPR